MYQNSHLQYVSFEDVSQILSSREIIFSSLSRRPSLLNAIKTNARDTRLIEVQALLESSRMSRNHGALQNSLTTATYLSALTEPCNKLGLEIGALTQFEVSNVLWDQGEMMASIRTLQSLNTLPDLRKQTIPIGKPELLAKLVSISEGIWVEPLLTGRPGPSHIRSAIGKTR
jgi:ataxia telangiectasia mutated family protein